MEKKIAGLLGAAAALGTLNAAQAAPTPDPSQTLRASSYTELLQPIPNAAALLQAIDEQAPAKSADENVQVAQYSHHHHHHHHHHHNGYHRGDNYGYGPRVIVVPRRHHHHHHHHHHSFYRRDY